MPWPGGAGCVVGEADVFVDANDGARDVPLRAVGDDPVAGRERGRGKRGGVARYSHTIK